MDSNDSATLLQKEVLISTDITGQSWNATVWDYTSGTNLQTFKNCSTVSQGLCFLKNHYMLCATYNKPHIIYWNLKGKVSFSKIILALSPNLNQALILIKPQPCKINTTGCVNCMAATKCGNYLAIGIEEKVFLLQVIIWYVLTVFTKKTFLNISFNIMLCKII
jgi:hypothetical protein